MIADLIREVKCEDLGIGWTSVKGMTHVEAASHLLQNHDCEVELDKAYKVQTRCKGSKIFFDHIVTVTMEVHVLPLRQSEE